MRPFLGVSPTKSNDKMRLQLWLMKRENRNGDVHIIRPPSWIRMTGETLIG
jgi:hypothetical protein